MKIAFNPSTVAALTAPPNNKDITFDLRGQNIFARGVKFYGTDTNTWRDIKINNVSIGSHILDLRNGSNTTLTNTNGVVTINSTWRPVVDNLTSDSTTSSLSANQGRVLAGLINGKSDSDHNHDDRYLKLIGGTLTGNLVGTSAMFSGRFYGNGDDEGIIIKPSPNGYAGLILGTHDGERSVFYYKPGAVFWRYGNSSGTADIYHPKKSGIIALTSDIPSKDSWNYDDRYIKKVGGMPTNACDLIITPGYLDPETVGDSGGGIHVKAHTGTPFQLWLHDTSNVWYKKTGNGNWTKMDAGYADVAGSVTWDNVTNKPATATRWPSWDEIANKPNTFTPSNHSHDFLVVNEANEKSFNSSYHHFQVLYAGEGNRITGRPDNVDAFGLIRLRTAQGWSGQMLLANGGSLYIRSNADAQMTNTLAWRTILDSSNYSSILDSRYYTESEIDTKLAKKLDRVKLTTGSWNPRSYNLAADYCYNGGDLSISESGGQIHVSVDGYFWQKGGKYRVLDTSDVAGLKGDLTVHQYLSNTDTAWWPLIWGGSDHNNVSDSTGAVYKSHDVLSWQTSSQTLYATRLQTTFIDLENNRGISRVTSGGTSPFKGIKLPYLQSNGVGIFSKVGEGDDADEGGVIISADTSVIYNSFDTGWGLTIRDKDKGQMNISGDGTIAFGVRQDYRAYSLGGFAKAGSSNSYVLLGGGDHKLERALNVANADMVDGLHGTDGRTFNGNINWSSDWNDAWSDGTNKHPWYGFDHRYPNTGAYSTTITDYFGMTIKTANTLRLDCRDLLINGTNISNLNVASASKLQTPRTIWGQSFDGTGNVNGTIYINNSNSSNGAIRLNSDISSNARISAIDDQVVFNTGAAIRFGATKWEYSDWAGLKYDTVANAIYLGIADGTVFNYYSNKRSNGTLKFPGITTITPDSGARIGDSGGNLYLGNSNNSAWVKVQDMCSQSDSNNWRIYQGGSALFKSLNVVGNITAGGYVKNGSSDAYVLLGGGGHMMHKTGSTSWSTAIQFGKYVWLTLQIDNASNGISVVPTNISNPTKDIYVMNAQLGTYGNSRHGRYRVAPNGMLYYVDGVAGMCIYTTICYVAYS